jgi:predicted phosphodiesterase
MSVAERTALPRRAWQRLSRAVSRKAGSAQAPRRFPLPRPSGHWFRNTRERRLLLAAEVLLIGLVGCWLGLLAGGNLEAGVGPLQTRLSVAPSLTGGSTVAVPPLGELHVDTHDGPWQLDVEISRIDAADARRIFSNPASVNGLGEQVVHDLRGAVITVAVRSALAAVAGALVLGLLVFRRRWRLVALSGAVSGAVVLSGGAVAAATWNPAAINEPEYDGLLASAPSVVGNAQDIVANFSKYEDQLAKLVTNVSRLYDVTSTLPAYQADSSTIRVLFVSDLHLNPTAWDVIRSVTDQFHVDLIVDGGDLTDHGSAAENTYVDQIATLGVPYVWVRGNHDSLVTQAAVADQPNAVVLDGAKPVEVGGLRFIGYGDPRFTPDKNTRDQAPPASVKQVGLAMADALRAEPADQPVDVAVVHDGAAAPEMDGLVPLVLSGHYHRREQHALPGGTLSFYQGSTGASGLRGLEHEKPTPVRASVLYFDQQSRALQAWDDITLGGLGLASAKIERRILAKQFPELAAPASPSPSATPAPSGSSGSSGSPSPAPAGP